MADNNTIAFETALFIAGLFALIHLLWR